MSKPKQTSRIHLRILHSTDLHGALRGYDYLSDKPSPHIGLSRTATLISAARADAANALLFDTGDFLQGSPVCDLAAQNGLPPGQVHPMIAAMNALGYDALTPGNHDFNHGADFLLRALQDADFPVVSANFLHADPDRRGTPVFAPFTILDRDCTDGEGRSHRLRIAVIGCLPPQTIAWDHALAGRYDTEDMVLATRRAVDAAQRQGCDLVVLLAHTGIDPEAPASGGENTLIELTGLDGVDLVLGGHSHRIFPTDTAPAHPAIDAARGTIHGTPVLMSGFSGNHLGQADLTLEQDGADWQVAAAHCCLRPLVRRDTQGRIASDTPEDPEITALTAAAHDATMAHVRQPVGETLRPLHSFFALLANDASVQLVTRAQAAHLRKALAGTPHAELPLLSAASPFKTGRLGGPDHFTHVPAGPLSRRSITDLYVYPNTLCAVVVTGRQLREWLELSASVFTHVPPGTPRDTPLLDEGFPGYKFDVICGVTYRIDPARPARYDNHGQIADPGAWRIRELAHRGRRITDADRFVVATNSYRVFGVGFARPPPDVVYEAPVSSREILREFIRAQPGPLNPEVKPVWSFALQGGLGLRFETSPLARAYLDDPLLPPLEDLGDTPCGFARFRVTL